MIDADSPRYTLASLGWDEARDGEFVAFAGKHCVPGRVAIRHKGMYTVLTAAGEIPARIKGHLRYEAETFAELPVVGDWVAVGRKEHETLWLIHGVLNRRTVLRRKTKGLQTTAQVLAANVTTVVVVMGLTEDFNLRRLERFLILVSESGARPYIVLNKSDLLDEVLIGHALEEVRSIAGDAAIAVTSASTGEGVEVLDPLMQRGETLVFIGSSGQGKSTLINSILGTEHFRTGDVRESDGRGRHTTTTREMVPLPSGAVLIDSPGIREIQLWDSEEGLQETFNDVVELALRCKFRNCTHTSEPGCAIIAAIEEGELSAERFASFMNLQQEGERLRAREQEIREKKKAFKDMKRKW